MQDDAGQVHFGKHFNDAGAANTRHTSSCRCLCKARIIRPQVTADDLETGLQGLRIDTHALNSSGSSTLPATDLGAFKSGPCRAGTREQALVVSQHDFSVGTHIHQQGNLV